MRTYVLDTLNRIRRKSEELDAKTILTNKAWKIFNDEGDEETIYFLENGKLRVSINGITTSGTWELFVEDRSVHIMYDGQKNGILLKPKFDANGILAMQLDGTNKYSFLIDKKNNNLNNIKTLSDLNNFYKQIEQAEEKQKKQEQLAIEARKAEEERERKRLEYEQAEQEKQRKLEEKLNFIKQLKAERSQLNAYYSSRLPATYKHYSQLEILKEFEKLGSDLRYRKYLKYKRILEDLETMFDKYEFMFFMCRDRESVLINLIVGCSTAAMILGLFYAGELDDDDLDMVFIFGGIACVSFITPISVLIYSIIEKRIANLGEVYIDVFKWHSSVSKQVYDSHLYNYPAELANMSKSCNNILQKYNEVVMKRRDLIDKEYKEFVKINEYNN